MKAKRLIAGLILGTVIWLLVSGSITPARAVLTVEFSFTGGGNQTQMWVNFDPNTAFQSGNVCCIDFTWFRYGTWTCTAVDTERFKWNCSGTLIQPDGDTLMLTFTNTSLCLEVVRWGWGARPPSESGSQLEPAGPAACPVGVGGIAELPEIAANNEALSTPVSTDRETTTSDKASFGWLIAVLAGAGLAVIAGFGALRLRRS